MGDQFHTQHGKFLFFAILTGFCTMLTCRVNISLNRMLPPDRLLESKKLGSALRKELNVNGA